MLRPRLTILLIALGARATYAAAPDPVVFDRIGLRSGLSQGTIRCMFQDRRGFLWFGTQDGLNRYDGQSFVVYRHIAGDPYSLPNNSISRIAEDQQGGLWVATTGGGIARLERATGRFLRYSANPKDPNSLSDDAASALVCDRHGQLWVGTHFGGLNQFDPTTGTFHHFRHDAAEAASLTSNDITALFEDSSGALWVGTSNGGMDRLDATTGRFIHFRHDASHPDSLIDNKVNAIYEDRSGRFWVGTERGAAQLDRQTGKFLPFSHNAGQRAIAASKPVVNDILQDASGQLWIGCETGLERVGPAGDSTLFRSDPSDDRTLSDSVIRSIFEDRSGTVWFGSGHGINRINPGSLRFATFRSGATKGLSNNMVRAFYEAPDGVTWIGTDFGLNRYDPKTGAFRVYLHSDTDPSSLPHDHVTAIAPAQGGRLWIGTNGGLSLFDPLSGRFQTWHSSASDIQSLSYDLVFTLEPAADGALWVGTRDGLNWRDPATGKFRRYLHDAAQPASLAHNDVRALVQDRDGMLWVGTRLFGLDRLDPATGTFTHFRNDPADPGSLGGNAVYALLIDHRGQLWVGTTTGLSLRDGATGRFTRFTEKDGLPNDTIYAIEEDALGRLWIGTGRGLARFDAQTKLFRSYDVSNGLQDNEFNARASWYSPASHNMYFGGVSGYNRFVPEKIRDSSFQPPVVLTSFRVLGSPLPGVLESGRTELTWRDPMFSVEFAALDYSAPDENRYAYMLEGFDTDWHYTQAQRLATYTNLGSGRYRFRVRGTNSDGIWSPQEATLAITIIPPPWKRWWFIAIMALLGTCLMVWTYRARVARFRAAQAAQEAFSRALMESQESERKRIAAELHDSLGQNLIVIRNHALMALASHSDPGRTTDKLEEISSAASDAIEEVREIARSLHPQQLDRLGLSNALASIVDRAAASSSIRFLAAIEPIDGLLSKEGEINLYRIVQESINNVLKHSQATEAGVSAECTGQTISIRIYDNGRGFDPKALAPDRRGMGLAGISERARIIGANCSIESAPGRGTVILLDIDTHAKSVGADR